MCLLFSRIVIHLIVVSKSRKGIFNKHVGFLQIVLVSVGAGRQTRKLDGSIPSASLPVPPRERLPMMLLNQEPYFDQLFTMLEKLSRLDLTSLPMVSGVGYWNELSME